MLPQTVKRFRLQRATSNSRAIEVLNIFTIFNFLTLQTLTIFRIFRHPNINSTILGSKFFQEVEIGDLIVNRVNGEPTEGLVSQTKSIVIDSQLYLTRGAKFNQIQVNAGEDCGVLQYGCQDCS